MGSFMGSFVDSAAGITWVNLSSEASGHADSADRDTNSQHSAFASDATGTSVTALDTVAVDGWNEGAQYDVADLVTVFPSWLADGDYGILVRATTVTAPALTSGYWQSLAILEAGTPADGVASGVKFNSSAAFTVALTATSTYGATALASPYDFSAFWLFSRSFGRSNVAAAGDAAVVSAGDTGGMTNPIQFAICAGCDSAAAGGPFTGKILWQAALIKVTP